MTLRPNAGHHMILNHGVNIGRDAVAPNEHRSIMSRVLTFFKSVWERMSAAPDSGRATQRRRQELQLSVWALGYCGFAREAERRYRELQRLEAGVE